MSDKKLPFNMKRVPWGFKPGKDGYLVATTSAAQRWHRGALGEAAIRICIVLGIPMSVIEDLVDVEDAEEILAKLQERQS